MGTGLGLANVEDLVDGLGEKRTLEGKMERAGSLPKQRDRLDSVRH